MIRVNYQRIGARHRLAVEGHAGHSDIGTDIVCAGVSAVSYALLGYLLKSGCNISEARADSGELLIDCTDKRAEPAFEMALVGYNLIAKDYPQNVVLYSASNGG